jgi:DNA polymerase I-like protein with 3'-5' exonuclease and polymerase domains
MKVSINFRRYLLADPGYLIYSLDLAQAENRVVAYVGNIVEMMKAFEKKVDIHRFTGAMIATILSGNLILPDEVSDEFRQLGKKSNHGLNYGLGYRKFALLNGMEENRAQEVYEAYHQAYPGVKQWHLSLQEKLRKNKTLESCYMPTEGIPNEWCLPRVRVFRAPWSDELLREAYSFIPQNTVAESVNVRGILYCYYNQHLFKHVEILNQVHDSIVFQIPISAGLNYHCETVNAIKFSLEQPIYYQNRSFSIPVDIEVGLNLGDKTKVGEMTVEWLEKLCENLNVQQMNIKTNNLEIHCGRSKEI